MKRACFVTIILLVFATTLLSAEKKDVTITAADGFALKGTLYSAGKIGPGILLLHQCNADRQIYDTLGTMLSAAGYNALTLDFRGFGGSKNAQFQDLASARDKMPGDVDAAFQFLTTQGLVNKTVLGVIGGSCGVNQAIQAARRHPEVKTLVLLSGGTDGDGEMFIKNAAKMPIFGAVYESKFAERHHSDACRGRVGDLRTHDGTPPGRHRGHVPAAGSSQRRSFGDLACR